MFYFENYFDFWNLWANYICEFHFRIEWGCSIILCKGAVGFDEIEVTGWDPSETTQEVGGVGSITIEPG